MTVVTAACRAYLPMDDLVDKKAETARLTKELEGAKKQLATAEAKLQNEKFISKAPQKRGRRGEGQRGKAAGEGPGHRRGPGRPAIMQ